MVLNRSGIKADARAFLGENTRWWKFFLAFLPVFILEGVFGIGIRVWTGVVEPNSGGYGSFEVSFGGRFLDLVSLLMMPIMVALAGYCLNAIRGFNPTWQSLYKEGFDRYGKYFVVAFLVRLFTALWTLLFIIPGIIKTFAWSQTDYIIHDNPNLSAKEAREISARMTDGYKADLFVLSLSFIPWILLSGITCGIALIYVLPYIFTVSAMYYENLKSNAIATGRVAPEAFGIMPVPPMYDNAQAPGNFNAPFAPQDAAGNPVEPFYPQPQQEAPSAPQSAAPDFTPPAPEETFRPGDKTILNGEVLQDDPDDRH